MFSTSVMWVNTSLLNYRDRIVFGYKAFTKQKIMFIPGLLYTGDDWGTPYDD